MSIFGKITLTLTLITIILYIIFINYYRNNPEKYQKAINNSRFDALDLLGLFELLTFFSWLGLAIKWIWNL